MTLSWIKRMTSFCSSQRLQRRPSDAFLEASEIVEVFWDLFRKVCWWFLVGSLIFWKVMKVGWFDWFLQQPFGGKESTSMFVIRKCQYSLSSELWLLSYMSFLLRHAPVQTNNVHKCHEQTVGSKGFWLETQAWVLRAKSLLKDFEAEELGAGWWTIERPTVQEFSKFDANPHGQAPEQIYVTQIPMCLYIDQGKKCVCRFLQFWLVCRIREDLDKELLQGAPALRTQCQAIELHTGRSSSAYATGFSDFITQLDVSVDGSNQVCRFKPWDLQRSYSTHYQCPEHKPDIKRNVKPDKALEVRLFFLFGSWTAWIPGLGMGLRSQGFHSVDQYG